MGRAASDAMFRVNRVDIGLAADQGTLGQESKLGGNALLLHELVFSAQKFGAENTLVALSCVARRARSCVPVEFAEVVVRRCSVAVVGNKRFIMHVLTRAFLFSSLPSADEVLN